MTSAAVPFILVVATLCAGCGSSSSASNAPTEMSTVTHYGEPDASDAGTSEDATSSADTPLATQTPIFLCNMPQPPAYVGCNPDVPTPAASCPDAVDAGWFDGAVGDGSASLACHVMESLGDAAAQPACTTSGSGLEGDACSMPEDCAATNECVGAGICRHYCCLGNTACAADQFCDVELVAPGGTMKVPVCAPIHPCGLLAQLSDAGTCDPTQTCTVVRDGTGETSCVAIGPVRAGGSCDGQACATGLVCLGTWGTRHCYTLCHAGAPVECSSGQACQSGLPIFTDPAVGVCE